MREQEIIGLAIRKFEEETGLRVREVYNNAMPNDRGDVRLVIEVEGHTIEFNAEVKLFINNARLGLIANNMNYTQPELFENERKRAWGIPLLITEYVNPNMMKMMENNGINFMDAAGNALIKVPPLYIKIKGNRLNENYETGVVRTTFNTATLQTIFTILCNPEMERNPIREIAEMANVAVGTVHRTLRDLQDQGYLITRNNEYALVNKKNLLEKWITLYTERLRPKFYLGRYEADENRIRNIDLKYFDAQWGGEAAAEKMTNYLRAYIYTIYIAGNQGEFILRNRLKRNTNGNVLLMKKFWNYKDFGYNDVTHPILVYADLLATGDPRNIETANIIYENEIARYITEN